VRFKECTGRGPGPFTVFAPTDDAFAKLPAGTLDNLLKPENQAMLRRVLTYHVVPGKVMAADVAKARSARTVSGDTLSIKVSGGTVTVGKAGVVKTDIVASNGVIHVLTRSCFRRASSDRRTDRSRLLRVLEGGGAVRCLADGVGRVRPAAIRWATAAVVLAAAAVLQATAAAAQTPGPVRTVPFVDLDRYVGDWHEIARLPNRFQRRCVGDVRASYARRADGRLDVVNQCRTGDGRILARGIARVVDDRTFARLKVRFAPAWLTFLPFVWGDYWIIGLAEDYSWAVVGSPDREYLWILARTPRLDEKSAAAARDVARANGFDVERLIQTAREESPRW
jgi:apolipoprotein D and lipocalin family protein